VLAVILGPHTIRTLSSLDDAQGVKGEFVRDALDFFGLMAETRYHIMNFHFARKLIALFALWGVLGMLLCWGQTKPPNGIGPHEEYAVTYHRALTNQLLGGTQLERTELLASARAIELARDEMQGNGQLAMWTSLVLQYAAVFESAHPNFSQYFPKLQADGYAGAEAILLSLAETTTQAERIAFVNTVENGGMFAALNQVITQINAIANSLPSHYGPVIPPCRLLGGTAAWMGMVAAGSALAGPEAWGITAVFGFVSATFTLSYFMYGC
jgi:hypothetical protein